MNFSILEDLHQQWNDILVIGKTIERNNKKYHMIGMTLSDEAKLYIIEPYQELESYKKPKKGIPTHRSLLKQHDETECCYLRCSDFYFGEERIQVAGGTSSPLAFSSADYGMIQLFFDMMNAGWTIPKWLIDEEWDNLQLVTLNISDLDKLPAYEKETPITIKHRPDSAKYIVEKTITLTVGKGCTFSFPYHTKDNVTCYINQVTLIDVWKDTEERFHDPKLVEKFSPEQLQQAKKYSYEALEQNCPKGQCYIGIKYECSKDVDLIFYSKEYLNTRQTSHQGSASFLLMRLKPEKETGTHHLPLKGCVISTPVSPDTTKIPAELFLYYEKANEWEETVL